MRPLENPVFVTQPITPDRTMLYTKLDEVLNSKHFTNFGAKMRELEKKLVIILEHHIFHYLTTELRP